MRINNTASAFKCFLICLRRMAQILSENWDLVECSLRAAAKRISPEKFDPVLEAAAAIREFPARQGLMFSQFNHPSPAT
jgi:hypothetical protein